MPTSLINGVLTSLTGRSPGKFIVFLNVKDAGGDPPGIANGILREPIKAVSLGFVFGMIWARTGRRDPRADVLRSVARPGCRGLEAVRSDRDAEELAKVPQESGAKEQEVSRAGG